MVGQITVVGSANLDIVVNVEHHPRTGETVLGGDHLLIPGGKGANQAVAAARLGAEVSFIGMIGNDDAGCALRASLETAGVNTSGLAVSEASPSGIALITVDQDGDNAITVSPGANMLLTNEMIDRSGPALTSDVTQLQLEIPMDVVIHAAEAATGIVVLDPAPAPVTGIPLSLLAATDVLVPNETELALLAKRNVDAADLEDVTNAARSLSVETVVVTLGANGAVVVTQDSARSISAPRITAVDTTAAGDAFRSALSVKLASGVPVVEAAQFAVRVGAATALMAGAQPSLPTASQVDERLA